MDKIINLFFEESLRRWHFEDIIRESGMSRERVNYYLKKLVKEGYVAYNKKEGKMPYYTANVDARFRTEKRLYGLNKIKELIWHLASLEKLDTAIIFGSFARGDFGKSSDIDLFVFGDDSDLEKGKFEKSFGREIQLFSYNESKDIRMLEPKVVANILEGFKVKGNLDCFKVVVNV